MSKRNWPTVIAGGIVVGALAAAFVLSQGGAGQVPVSKTGAVLSQSKGLAAVSLTGNDAAPAVQQAMAPAPVAPGSGEAAPPGPGVEGIKVSGHWTIEVREPDGRLVSRTEFENALTTSGVGSLAAFLARDKTPGLWRIHLNGSTSEPCLNAGTPAACIIAESGDPTSVSNIFKNLAVNLTSANTVMQLSGTATAQQTVAVTKVTTYVYKCANTVAPASPCSSVQTAFTEKTLATPVSITQNQQLAVTVDFSFN